MLVAILFCVFWYFYQRNEWYWWSVVGSSISPTSVSMVYGAQASPPAGSAAAIVSGAGPGLELGEGLSATLEDSDGLITWHIGDTGFHMHLSGEVPGRIRDALLTPEVRARIAPQALPEAFAVHAGGRSILDAVESGLGLAPDALDHSRAVLRDFGNMSSSTLMFVLERTLRDAPRNGVALAFGPGLAMEGFRFGWSG